jgi:hypothetical protein
MDKLFNSMIADGIELYLWLSAHNHNFEVGLKFESPCRKGQTRVGKIIKVQKREKQLVYKVEMEDKGIDVIYGR